MKYTVKYLKSAAYLLAFASMICITGCKDDDDIYHPYDDVYSGDYAIFAGSNSTEESLEVDTNGMIGESFANSMTYDMYTNAGDWKIEYDFSRCFNPKPEISWIEAWPNEGNGDGRFTIKFYANTDQGDTRYANINIVSGGKIIKTIAVKQAGATSVRLGLAATFMSILNLEANDTADKTVPLSVNVFWDAYVEYADEYSADWVHLKEITNVQNLQFNIDQNYTTETRTATIVIYQITDPNNTTTITINQKGVSE